MKRILAFWSLNGRLTKEGLQKKIDDFRSAGIGGFFLHARAGLTVEYLSDEWFSLIRYAAEYAHSVGLEAWLYDENGWPSGYAGGRVPKMNPSYRQSWMNFLSPAEVRADDEIIARDEAHGRVAVRRYNPYYSNLLDEGAVDAFIETTYEAYRRHIGDLFGTAVKGIFTDEPQLSGHGYPVFDGMFAAFEARYGYSLYEHLFEIEKNGKSVVKYDYRRLIAERYADTYAARLGRFCEAHGLIFTGHMAAEDGIYTQVQTQGDIMPNYRYFTMPGIDVLTACEPKLTLLKQVSSVAEQLGKCGVLAETFGTSGHTTTPEELLRVFFTEAMYGVSVCCMHLSAYSLLGRRKRDYPPDFSAHMCHFEKLSEWTGRLDKLCRIASEGKRVTDVLVMSPIGAIWSEYANKGLPIDTSRPYRYEDLFRELSLTESQSDVAVSYRMLEENLAALGYDYHLGDERLLAASAKLDAGALRIGDYTYRTVIIPKGDVLDKTTVRLLSDFAESGGRLLFVGKRPRSVEGDDVFSDLWEAGLLRPLSERRAECDRQMTAYGMRPNFEFFDTASGRRAEGLICTARECTDSVRVFVRNTQSSERGLSVSIGEKEYFFRLPGDGYAVLTTGEHPSVYRPAEDVTEPLSECPDVTDVCHLPVTFSYRPESPNVLVLDRCRVTTDGEEAGEGYVLHVNEELYHRLSGVRTVTAEYTFNVETPPESLSVAAETGEELQGVYLNGKKLSPTGETYVTEDFALYGADGLAVVGENRVTLVYRIDATNLSPMVEAFETESNVYFRKTELDFVFLLGNFSVVCDGSYSRRLGRTYRTVRLSRLRSGAPASEEEAPFYRGRVAYDASFVLNRPIEKEERIFLSVGNSYPVLTLSLNGSSPVTSFGERVEVTTLIRRGENRLHIVAYTRNRNLFGPHHYFDFDNEYVGPSVFAGRRGWEDRFNAHLPFACIPECTFVPDMSVIAERLTGDVTLYITRKTV